MLPRKTFVLDGTQENIITIVRFGPLKKRKRFRIRAYTSSFIAMRREVVEFKVFFFPLRITYGLGKFVTVRRVYTDGIFGVFFTYYISELGNDNCPGVFAHELRAWMAF